MGRGWRLSYETELYVTGNTIQIIQADGTRIIFTKDPNNPSVCASPNPTYGQIHIQGNTYQWRWPNGRILDFNQYGKLVQIVAPTGEFVSLQYDHKNWLMSVRDPQGRVLRFNYLDQKSTQKGDRYSGLQSIDSPVGRFNYSYGSNLPKGATIDKIHLLANLVKVSIPTHYDAKQLAHPYANRGVSSSSISRTYHYEDANHPTLLTGISVTGQGSDKQLIHQRISTYGYDINGNAILSMKTNGAEKVTLDRSEGGTTILTNSLGQKTTYKHAIIAGEYRLLEAVGPGCTSCSPGNRRYSYDKLGQLIEETTLNHSGKPLQTTKTERDKDGRPIKISHIAYKDGKPQVATWERRYGYEGSNIEPSLIAQPSVVAGKESITKITYNPQGQPTAITQSGWSPAIDGKSATPITRTTTYRYSTETSTPTNTSDKLSLYDETQPANRWMEINGPLPSQITRIEYDAKTGLVVKTITPGNHITEVLERDSALRPSKIRSNDGIRTVETPLQYKHVTEPDQIGVSQKTRTADTPEQPTGTHLIQAQWGEIGTAAQNQIIKFETPHKQAERRFDDFGRVIAIKNPDQGWQTATYDAVDRIIATTDARGARQTIRYSAQGYPEQIERWSNSTLNHKAESTTQIRYAGQQPVDETITDANGTRRTQTQYDASGREINVIQTITLKGRTPVTFTQAYTYDDQDRRSNIQLNDQHGTSSTIHNHYDNQGRIAQITTQGWLPNWLGGQKMLVRAIQWQKKFTHDIATSLTHGNGKVDSWPQKAEQEPASSPQLTTTNAAAPSPRAGSQHDEAGLPHQLMINAKTWNLNWDAAGRLQDIQQTQQPQGTHATYLYDARGRRVAKILQNGQAEPTITYFAYDGVQLRGEADAQGKITHSYAYLGYRPVAQIDHSENNWWSKIKAKLFGATIHHLHTDQVGQVTAMSDAKQGVLPKSHQPLRYIGQYADEETSLYYHGARFYDPSNGKFISPDPAGIADALSDVPPELLLDTYAYAGGNPQLFFDPDGAARIRYFAITTGANGSALGTNQGFTKARWAFIVDNIQSGGNSSALGQKRNQYAQNGTELLYDANGDFLKNGQSVETWDSSDNRIPDLFADHYGNNLVSIAQFTINNMSDDDATALIASYIQLDKQQVFNNGTCPARSLLLPEIKFAKEEQSINVTTAVMGNAHKQRILACGDGADANLEQRRVAKYEAAAEINETARINRNCSVNGCPGIGYYCDTTKCYAPRDQLSYGPPNTNEPVYTPSYGRSQFIASTLISELLAAYDTFTVDELTKLGLNQPMKQLLVNALVKAKNMANWWSNTTASTSYSAANQSWTNLSAANRTKFTTETGLGERAYVDMIRIKTQPPMNSNGDDLSGDAKQALVTSAIMSDTTVQAFLMGIFSDSDKFTVMSHALIRKNLNLALKYQPNASEEYLAAMVARAHNGGVWQRSYQSLITNDTFKYVKNFLGTPGYATKGDWNSLRCTENIRPNNVKSGEGIEGLELTPLS